MINKKDLDTIRDQLKKSENPLFFFDDDCDGLCSFLLFRRFLGRGKGIPVKGKPMVTQEYAEKIKEYSPDKVFILDKPIVEQEFIDKVHVPIIWIDHHPPVKRKGIRYYNPRLENSKDNTPVTYWCYKIVKQDLWIALVGSVADWYIPDFIKKFAEKHKDLLPKYKKQEDVLYKTEFGNLIRIIGFLLKGKTSDVKKNISILSRVESPYEILNQTTPRGKFLFKRIESVEKTYDSLLEKISKIETKEKLIVFLYPSGKFSLTSELSNELLYRFPNKIILVGRQKGDEIRLSLRSKNLVLPPILEKALQGVSGYGGGHDNACGGNVAKKDFFKFVSSLKKQIK